MYTLNLSITPNSGYIATPPSESELIDDNEASFGHLTTVTLASAFVALVEGAWEASVAACQSTKLSKLGSNTP